jgi:hypothetical protein
MTNSREIINSIYDDMITANRKAEAASHAYNERAAGIAKAESDARPDLPQIYIDEAIRHRKEKDVELNAHFKTYSFYKGEVQRFSDLLQGIAAFKQIRNIGYTPIPPSSVINVSDR